MNYSDIIGKIQKAKDDYYNYGTSQLTDQEYDQLVAQAEKLGYVETVGASPVDSIKKIKHEHPMLSLDKVHSTPEIRQFMHGEAVMMHKLDGLTISATYIDGKLTRLETRGDGKIGNDIMFHANSISNLPKRINKIGKYVVDGECIIYRDDFDKINSSMTESERFSNPRNLAAGSLNLLDPKISKQRCLKFVVWDVIDGGESGFLSYNLKEAELLGFDVVEWRVVNDDCSSYGYNIFIEDMRNIATKCGIPIDGLVFKHNSIAYGKSLGATDHHFRNAIAYKFNDSTYPTRLKEVVWQVGKTGQITPVATFEPVEIDGSVVEKCSLHNLSIMSNLGLTNGCTVYVYLANCIIPQIDNAADDGDGKIELPSSCPICGAPTKVVRDNATKVLICANESCAGRILGLWKTFVSKKGFDIEGLSEATLEVLLKKGYINNCFVTIFQIDQYKDELYKLDGFGKRSIDKLLTAIRASTYGVDFVNFLTAFSIPGVGTGQSKILAAKFKTFPEFADACDNGYDFSSLSGIGPILNMNIHQWWFNNYIQMCDVAEVVEFASDEPAMNEPEIGDNKVAGLTFVISGSVNHFKNRGELQSKLESLGAKVSGSVSSKTDYLINNDNTSQSSKNLKAQKLGVPIITEEQLLEMIGN